MTGVIFVGNLEGGSTLLADDIDRGEVRHSLRVYRDFLRGNSAAVGKIWGSASVLQHAAAGQHADLRLENGDTVRVLVRRRSIKEGYACVGVDGAVPSC